MSPLETPLAPFCVTSVTVTPTVGWAWPPTDDELEIDELTELNFFWIPFSYAVNSSADWSADSSADDAGRLPGFVVF